MSDITLKGLKKKGYTGGEILLLSANRHARLWYDSKEKDVFLESRKSEEIRLPGIRPLADVDTMIRFLEGTDG